MSIVSVSVKYIIGFISTQCRLAIVEIDVRIEKQGINKPLSVVMLQALSRLPPEVMLQLSRTAGFQINLKKKVK